MDIAKIPDSELLDDLKATCADIIACQTALKLGITMNRDDDIKKRLTANFAIKAAIQTELDRRKTLLPVISS